MTDRVPELQDEVKHKKNDTAGVVIAKYSVSVKELVEVLGMPVPIGKTAEEVLVFLDVRVGGRIYYATPIENWEVVRTEEEQL